jgi:ABC-type nickel/cobalt efflux system permease component RcnA
MHLVGVIEIVAGLVVLSNLTRWGAYIVMFWLLGIALQLIAQLAFLDVAVRDIMMSLGAFTLARLTEVRQESLATDAVPTQEHHRAIA